MCIQIQSEIPWSVLRNYDIGLLLKWDLVAILLNPLGIEEGYRISVKNIHKYVGFME